MSFNDELQSEETKIDDQIRKILIIVKLGETNKNPIMLDDNFVDGKVGNHEMRDSIIIPFFNSSGIRIKVLSISRKKGKTMFKLNRSNFVLIFLLVCGQNSLISCDSIKVYLRFIPKALCFVLTILSIIVFCYNLTELFVVNGIQILTLFTVIPNIVFLIEDSNTKSLEKQIKFSFHDILIYLGTTMHIKLQMDNFMRCFNKKIIPYLFLLPILFLVRFFIVSPYLSTLPNVMVSIAFVYKYAATVNAVLHVDLMRFCLSSVNKNLNSIDEMDSGLRDCLIVQKSMDEMFTMLCQVKVIHFKLWKVSRQINKRFQWFLLAILLDSTLMIIHAIMGIPIFMYTTANDVKYILILRK